MTIDKGALAHAAILRLVASTSLTAPSVNNNNIVYDNGFASYRDFAWAAANWITSQKTVGPLIVNGVLNVSL